MLQAMVTNVSNNINGKGCMKQCILLSKEHRIQSYPYMRNVNQDQLPDPLLSFWFDDVSRG